MGTTGFPALSSKGLYVEHNEAAATLCPGAASRTHWTRSKTPCCSWVTPGSLFTPQCLSLAFFSLSSSLSFKRIRLRITQAYNSIPVGVTLSLSLWRPENDYPHLCSGRAGTPNHPCLPWLVLDLCWGWNSCGRLGTASPAIFISKETFLGLQRPAHGWDPDLYPATPQTELERTRKPLTTISH